MNPTNEQILAAVNECKGTAGLCLLALLVVIVGVGLSVVFQLVIGVVQIRQANYTAALLQAAKNFGAVNEQRRDDVKQGLSRVVDKLEEGSALVADKLEQGSAEAKATAAEVAKTAAAEAARVAARAVAALTPAPNQNNPRPTQGGF